MDLVRNDGSAAFSLRSVAGGELLVGLKDTDAKRPKAVVARRLPTATQAGKVAVDVDDADELRRQGMDLVLAGRYGVARAPLQRSLSIYGHQAEATNGKTYKPLILTQMEQVLMLLAACDLRQEDYTAYLDDLHQGAKLLQALRAAEVAQPLVSWRATPSDGSGAGERQGNISDSAIQAANRLAQQPELLWARAVGDPTKVDLLEKLQSFFGELVLVLLEANQKGAALVVSETARSRALIDLLAARKEIKAGFAMSSIAAGKGLPSPTTVAPLSLEELLEIVRRRGSTTIEYFLTEETLAIWVISPRGAIDAVTVPLTEHFPANGASPRAALAKAIDELHGLLDSTPTSSAIADASGRMRTAELLRQLHGLLIGSIPERLLPNSAETPITIIPHAELLGVPFAALRDASSRYFIESHTLVYGPSLAVLKYSREDRERLGHREPRLLALVNPRPMPIAEDGKRWTDLGELEVNFPTIAGFYTKAGRRVLVGEEASKAALFAHAKEASELCLVTHAKFLDKPSDPLDSYIALAAGAAPEDGYLRVLEAFRLELQAELVLLWACETGRGQFSGDGVQGLSRAFIWAGSPNLMLSLWSVAPKASAMQMYGFHQLWRQKGRALAQALRLAQLEQMELYRDQPGVWAAFVLYGEGN
ncbi:MAG TPA: CHAT domain-containing protein [Thermoanaerobaculia bacterium]|nr:CHAT domain-containing protein [Thermoanaerobaculia bacterium]